MKGLIVTHRCVFIIQTRQTRLLASAVLTFAGYMCGTESIVMRLLVSAHVLCVCMCTVCVSMCVSQCVCLNGCVFMCVSQCAFVFVERNPGHGLAIGQPRRFEFTPSRQPATHCHGAHTLLVVWRSSSV